MTRKGHVIFSPLLTTQDVLHVPNMSCNLLSLSKLTRDKRRQIHFIDTHCLFQDWQRQLVVLSIMEDYTSMKMNLKPDTNMNK